MTTRSLPNLSSSLVLRPTFVCLGLAFGGTFLTLGMPGTVLAQSTVDKLNPIVVTGNLLGADLFELAPAVSTLSGSALMLKQQSSLGETLAGLPGVSSSYFGPNASRPVIRGLDSDRIRILENGVGMLDVSSLSNDHATTIDPLFIDRIEVLRGPAALLYGGSAVGGVVNVIDRRIVQAPLDGATGAAELRIGGAEHTRSDAALADFGNGQLAMHVDVFDRKTRDLSIPGYAHSARQRGIDDPSLDQAQDHLPNSASDARGGAVGFSITGQQGYAGVSAATLENNYGTVAELESTIRMKQDRYDFSAELRDLGWLKKIKAKAGYTDYQHTEFDAGIAATSFKNKGYEARIEALHGALGPLDGAFGLQLSNTTFSALGLEAFVPQTTTRSGALFVYEELPLGNLKLNGGGRIETTRLTANGGGPIDPPTGLPRFGNGGTRDFTSSSISAGATYPLSTAATLVFNAAATQRAPTYAELFANGVHAATGGYEIGDPNFSKEKSHSFEAALRFKQGPLSGTFTVYRTRFANYIGVFATGNTRGADGELNPLEDPASPGVALSGEDILTEYRYRQVPAVFTGFELEGKARLLDQAQKLDLEFGLDQVHATDQATGEPLPRIAPMRLTTALAYNADAFGARFEVIHASAQNRVPSGDTPTAAYHLLNASVTYRIASAQNANQALNLFARANNLTNQEARSATSFLREIAPLPGRGLQFGIRGEF